MNQTEAVKYAWMHHVEYNAVKNAYLELRKQDSFLRPDEEEVINLLERRFDFELVDNFIKASVWLMPEYYA